MPPPNPLITAIMLMSLPTAPSTMVSVRVNTPKSSFPLIVEINALAFVVTFPPSVSIPDPVVIVAPVIVSAPDNVRLFPFKSRLDPEFIVNVFNDRSLSKIGLFAANTIVTSSVDVLGTIPTSQFPAVPQSVDIAPVHVTIVLNIQFVSFKEFTEFVAVIAVAFVLLLSFTSANEITRTPCGLMIHCVNADDDRSNSKFPALPCNVSVPTIVCVFPDSNVNVLPVVTVFVKLLNVVSPLIA
jgi:hypothetical protein